jgi:hypothetical protein
MAAAQVQKPLSATSRTSWRSSCRPVASARGWTRCTTGTAGAASRRIMAAVGARKIATSSSLLTGNWLATSPLHSAARHREVRAWVIYHLDRRSRARPILATSRLGKRPHIAYASMVVPSARVTAEGSRLLTTSPPSRSQTRRTTM